MLPGGPFVLSAFVLGLLVGSFLNVCISRIPVGESVVSPRSGCPHCGHPIRWYDNIPLLSWILLRGRCRDCGGTISWRYPSIELVTGVWFVLSLGTSLGTHPRGYLTNFDIALHVLLGFALLATLGSLLIALLVIDWQTQTLPNILTLPGIVGGFLLVCMEAALIDPRQGQIVLHPRSNLRLSSPGSFASRGNVFLTGTERMVFGRLGAVIAVALLLLLVRWIYCALRKREGLGLGDVKLLAMIAAFLGLAPAVLALFVGVLSATAYATVLLARGRGDASTRLPFGSFLCAGGLLAALWGGPILAWYKSLL